MTVTNIDVNVLSKFNINQLNHLRIQLNIKEKEHKKKITVLQKHKISQPHAKESGLLVQIHCSVMFHAAGREEWHNVMFTVMFSYETSWRSG